MLIDPGEHVSQPGSRINVVQFGGDDERVHCRGSLTAAIGRGLIVPWSR